MQIPKFPILLKYHILLGVLLNFIPQFFYLHIYVFFAIYCFLLITSFENFQKFKHHFLVGFLYFPITEAVGRLHSLDPFVPWELGKYMSIFFVFILLLSGRMVFGFRFALGVLLILITILNGDTTWKLIFFNGSVIYCIMLMGDFFKSLSMKTTQLLLYLRFASLPLIVFLLSSINKLKDLELENSDLDSQFILDNIPANQIATYTGFGFFLFIIFFKNKLFFGLNQWQKVLIAFGFLIVGIISFSRGGVVVGMIGVVILYFNNIRNLFQLKNIKQILILVPILFFTAIYINKISNGNLFLRYQGETEGTLAGSKEKGFNTLTTNRYNILLGDINTFANHLVTGVETGRSNEYRYESSRQFSHIEFSRLMAEYGIVGFFVSILLLFELFNKENALLRALYLVGLLTTMHAATRTALPLLLLLISHIKLK
jgi:hypothetical protein